MVRDTPVTLAVVVGGPIGVLICYDSEFPELARRLAAVDKALRKAGAHTIAQDQASSVVWGMPGAAVSRGAAQDVVPLSRVCERLLEATARVAA